MAVSEAQRHQLYIVAESVFGTDGAATLMEYLPPTGWSDVARKSDIAALKSDISSLDERLSGRIDSLDERLSMKIESFANQVRAEFYKSQEAQTRLMIFSMVTCMFLVASFAFGAARLL